VLAQVALASLPWFAVFADLMPPLVKTLTSAAAVITVLLLVAPIRLESRAIRIGVSLLGFSLLIGTLTAVAGDQFIQSAKYVLFPAMAIAVVSERAQFVLPQVRRVVLASGILAVATHIVIILIGAGAVGTYYEIGEKLGFAASGPHNVALMSVIVAAAGLTSAKRNSARFAYLSLGTIPAIASGVRSAFVAVTVVLIVFLIQSRLNLRSIAAVAGAALVVLVSGAFSVVETRYRSDQTKGEFASLSSAGSGRGSIWVLAIHRYGDSGPAGWVRGTGLRSIEKFELQETGTKFVGHSDVIEVGVQLGLLGLAGWLLIWIGLLGARLRSLVLVPIAVYAVTNGAIEYSDSLVYGLALAAACATPRTGVSTLDALRNAWKARKAAGDGPTDPTGSRPGARPAW
jgi:O-Antigen ligase